MSMLRSQPIAEQEKRARAWREQFVENAVANVRLEGADLDRSAPSRRTLATAFSTNCSRQARALFSCSAIGWERNILIALPSESRESTMLYLYERPVPDSPLHARPQLSGNERLPVTQEVAGSSR